MSTYEIYELSTYKELSVLSGIPQQKIHLVMDEATNKIYVKKILSGTDHFNFYKRLSYLKHKNLVKIHDVICCDDCTYVFEEYVNGQSLQTLLENEGWIPEKNAVNYIMQLCDALIYLHSQNPPIIHRDIKPENIMLSDDDVIKLIDFDIAREFKQSARRDTIFMGTKEYAAPEQYGYKQTDSRTDIYAIGVLLHEMLTGNLPQNNIIYKGSLQKIIIKCLRLEPKQRYQSVFLLKKALANTRLIRNKKIMIYVSSAIMLIIMIPLISMKIIDYPNHAESLSPQKVLEQDYDNLYASKEIDSITITSEDGKFTAQIPNDWKEDNSINMSAVLQASKEKAVSYFVLVTENKEDLPDDTFETWKEDIFSYFSYLENFDASDEVKITINGRPAIQHTISGVNEGAKVKLLLTCVDGLNYYGQILCVCTESNYENNLSSFELITHSVRGL